MEVEEIEVVLEKIWDLHDKLSDAIHSISRTHFLNSINTLKNNSKKPFNDFADENRTGFVFVKDFRVDVDLDASAVQEAKSLNAIRTALENLEDQLEFFHTIQIQQRAERDAAIARLEQSRIILAMRLTEHHGKNYKVIEEAIAFVGDVHKPSYSVSPENRYGEKRSNTLTNAIISGFNFAKNFLKLDHMGGILGNAALVAVSMLALLHFHQGSCKDELSSPQKCEVSSYSNRNVKRSSTSGRVSELDVLLARG